MVQDPSAGVVSAGADPVFDEAWLRLREEGALDPELTIVDPHHHLWGRQRHPKYLFEGVLADVSSGHNVIGTVFVECGAMYRAHGPKALRSVGETEFANGVSAMSASGAYGRTALCAGIVGFADLRLGDEVVRLLEAHIAAAGGRFRGVRQISAWNASPDVRVSGPIPPPGLLADREFCVGFSHLSRLGLSFDAWLYHPQLPELAHLAAKFPDTRIVVDHVGGPIGIGPYAGRRDQAFVEWSQAIRHVARYPNVYVKLGGLGMKLGGFPFPERAYPPSSVDLATAWRPYIDTCIEAFSPDRCMFESNFPVEKRTCSYVVLWNSFKRMTASYSDSEKSKLFAGTAADFYQLGDMVDVSIDADPVRRVES